MKDIHGSNGRLFYLFCSGNLNIGKLNRLANMSRLFEPIDPLISSEVSLLRTSFNILLFVTHWDISTSFYDVAAISLPMVLRIQISYLGRSSVDQLVTFHCKATTSLLASCIQRIVFIDPWTHKTKKLPYDF